MPIGTNDGVKRRKSMKFFRILNMKITSHKAVLSAKAAHMYISHSPL